MMTLIRDSWTALRAYVPTMVVGTLLFVVLFLVPQVRGLFPSKKELADPGVMPLFYVFVGLIGIVFVTGFIAIMEPRLLPWPTADSIRSILDESRNQRADSAQSGTPSKARSGIRWTGVMSCLVAAVGILISIRYLPETASYLEFLEPPVRWTMIAYLLLWAIYFAIGQAIPEASRALVVRALWVFMIFGAAGELLWWIGLHWNFTSPRIYSIGAICHLVLVVVTTVAFIDRWQSLSPQWPVRLIFVAIVLLTSAVLLRSPTVGTLEDAKLAENASPAGDPTEAWLKAFQVRLEDQGLLPETPVILVASSGGGSRAALFSALVYEYFDQPEAITTLPADWFKNPGNPNGASGDLEYNPGNQVVLISSVSGGSLATACYSDPGYRSSERTREKVRSFYQIPMSTMIANEIDVLPDDYFRSHFKELAQDGASSTVLNAEITRWREDFKNPDNHWFLDRRLVDDMCADFMAPLLRGVIHPGIERGEAVTKYWEQQFTDKSISDRLVTPPLWMSNTTDVSSGGPLVVGLPAFPPELMTLGERADIALDQDTRAWHTTRWQAARLSANFPWGFQVANSPLQIERKKNRASNENQNEKIPLHLIDGGVFDNTGITSIRSLFDSIQRLAKSADGKPASQLASQVLETLRRRGVILVEIDSGAKPQPPGPVSRFFAGILEPLDSLSNASYHTSERANIDNLNAMRAVFRDPATEDVRHRLQYSFPSHPTALQKDLIDRLAVARVEGFQHIKITCNDQDNVMTAWALPPEEKAKIFVRYLVESVRFDHDLKDAVRKLTQSRVLTQTLAQKMNDIEMGTPEEQLAEIEERSKDFIAIANVMAGLRLEQEEKMVYEQLYAQNASPKQYAESETLMKAKKANRPDAVLESLRSDLMTIKSDLQSDVGLESVGGSGAAVSPKGGVKAQGADVTSKGAGAGGSSKVRSVKLPRVSPYQSKSNDDLEIVSQRLKNWEPGVKK